MKSKKVSTCLDENKPLIKKLQCVSFDFCRFITFEYTKKKKKSNCNV